MKKIFLTLLFIMTLFSISNINASHDCNKTLTIDQNGGSYSICGGLVILDIPSGAVSSKTTLETSDIINLSYDTTRFDIAGIGGKYDNGPAFLHFTLKDSNGNKINFKKGIKVNIKITKDLINYIGVIIGGEGDSFIFYKDGYKLFAENSSDIFREKYTLSNVSNFEIDKNNGKIYLSNITDLNGILSIAFFLANGGSLENFNATSESDLSHSIRYHLDDIKKMIIDKKSEILGYEKILGITKYSFYDEEQKYNNFLNIYKNNSIGTNEDFKNLVNVYEDLYSKFYLTYNNLKTSAEKSNTNASKNDVVKKVDEMSEKINNKLQSYKNIQSKYNLLNDSGNDEITNLKYEINNKIDKLDTLITNYKNELNYCGYSILQNYNGNSNYDLFNSLGYCQYSSEGLEYSSTGDSNYDYIYSKILSLINNYQTKLDYITSSGDGSEDNTNSNENNNSYAISRFEKDKSMINSSLEGQTFELEDIKDNTLKELNKINKNDDYLNQLKSKIKNYIDKKQTNLDNYKKTCNLDNLYSYYSSNNLEYVNIYLENNKCFNISNYFYNFEQENIKENNGKSIRELSSAYISNYYENSQNSIEDNNDENFEDINKSTISNTTYQLNEKEKSAVNAVSNKINKMSNIKKNKYKNLLNQYLEKFEYGSRKYEIVKGVLNLIK